MIVQPTGTIPVAAAAIVAGNVAVFTHPCIMLTVLVTITTTAAQAITFFDNTAAQGAVGTIVGIVPGGTAAGTIFALNMPVINGILIQVNAALAAGAITVSIC